MLRDQIQSVWPGLSRDNICAVGASPKIEILTQKNMSKPVKNKHVLLVYYKSDFKDIEQLLS